MRWGLGAVLAAGITSASGGEYGHWISGPLAEGLFYAATINDSGAMFGNICPTGAQQCMWAVTLNQGCETGGEHPILINAKSGSAYVTVLCDGPARSAGKWRYIFKNYDLIDKIAKTDYEVGFAMPLESGKFAVIRFDLRGSNEAIADMARQAVQPQQQRRPAGTRDYEM